MSTEKEILKRLRDCVVTFDSENVPKACEEALGAGIPAYEAIADGLSRGMEIVGRKYEAKECFLADLIMAGETMKEGMRILKPHLRTGDPSPIGVVVIGTVRGDLHDIGKDIVATLLEAAGFHIIDLGIDVSAEEFVRAVASHKADVLGMSALLTTTMGEMKMVITQIEKAGLRSKVKIIIGGAPISPEYGKEIGANAVGKDAVDGVNICKTWSSSTE
jgi:corrinoid protein of di/trimethylamine methyltransferase